MNDNNFLKKIITTANNCASSLGKLRCDSEVCIRASARVALMQKNNVRSFLVGEAFMRAANPGQALARLFADAAG